MEPFKTVTRYYVLVRPTDQSGDGLFFWIIFENFIAQANQSNGKGTKTKDSLYNLKGCQKLDSSFPSDFDELPIGITYLSDEESPSSLFYSIIIA